MIVLFRVPHCKNDYDFTIESFSPQRRKVWPGLEGQSISTPGERKTIRQKVAGSAIRISGAPGDLFPGASGRFDFKPYHHATGRASARSIKYVGGDGAHLLSSFSNLRRVIFRCSSAAIRNSAPGSLHIRSFRMASISAEVLPVAQTMKMKPKRCSYS